MGLVANLPKPWPNWQARVSTGNLAAVVAARQLVRLGRDDAPAAGAAATLASTPQNFILRT
jgi:hypothetical protein